MSGLQYCLYCGVHVPDDPCDDCRFLHGVGYNKHPVHCQLFYQCVRRGKFLVPHLQTCPVGMAWNQDVLTCVARSQTLCSTDLCLKPGVASYPVYKLCRSYWECANGTTSHISCCPAEHRYNAHTQTCVKDLTCTDPCTPSNPDVDVPVCDRLPHPTDRRKYLQILHAITHIDMNCPLGTMYNQLDCQCSIRNTTLPDPGPDECKPYLYMPFDKDLKDHSGNLLYGNILGGIYVDNIGGAVGGGAAFFNGRSHIIIPFFADNTFAKSFLITFRYLEVEGGEDEQCLLTNGDCNITASVRVAINKRSSNITANVRTQHNATRASLPYKQGWKNVEVRYDGKTLRITVNGVVKSVTATGDIVRVHSALQIGFNCFNGAYYRGYIDELKVYKCIPDDKT